MQIARDRNARRIFMSVGKRYHIRKAQKSRLVPHSARRTNFEDKLGQFAFDFFEKRKHLFDMVL